MEAFIYMRSLNRCNVLCSAIAFSVPRNKASLTMLWMECNMQSPTWFIHGLKWRSKTSESNDLTDLHGNKWQHNLNNHTTSFTNIISFVTDFEVLLDLETTLHENKLPLVRVLVVVGLHTRWDRSSIHFIHYLRDFSNLPEASLEAQIMAWFWMYRSSLLRLIESFSISLLTFLDNWRLEW